MEVSGRLKHIYETQTLGSNGFRKREVVIETDEQYPQTILVEFVQDKVDVLNQYAEGQSVKISINLKGREWINPQGEAKYFNSIQGWRMESLGTPNQRQHPPANVPPVAPVSEMDEEEDDLPF